MRSESARGRLHRRLLWLLGIALMFAVGLVGGFILRGQPAVLEAVADGTEELAAELSETQRQLSLQAERHRIDQGALEMLRQQLAAQQQELSDLQMALQFYRQLMAPESLPQSVAVRQIEVVETSRSGQYRYRVLVQQEANQHSEVDGRLEVVLLGAVGADDAEYQLAELDPESEDALALSFRYFQAIDGTITLPEGFVPDRFRIGVTVRSPQDIQLEQQFPWRVRPRFSHVGQ